MYRDTRHSMDFFHAADPVVLSSLSTTICDTQGYDSVVFCLMIGSNVASALVSTVYYQVRLRHGTSNAESDMADVTDGRTLTEGASAFSTTLTSGAIWRINDVYGPSDTWAVGYQGDLRYVQMVLEGSGTPPSIPVGVAVIRTPSLRPSTDTAE